MPSPRDLVFVLCAALTLAPAPGPRLQRNLDLDIERVKTAECEYQGITASFEDLTRAYAIEVYEAPRVVRWEARPSPRDPDYETLVAGVIEAAGVKETSRPSAPQLEELRRRAAPTFEVVWRLSTLTAVRIAAHNEYAQDALVVFRQTVNDFVSQLAYVLEPTPLRAGPGAEQPVLAQLAPGAVLAKEGRDGEWSQVRVPDTETVGWVPTTRLNDLNRHP
jgi:hypothetical protein